MKQSCFEVTDFLNVGHLVQIYSGGGNSGQVWIFFFILWELRDKGLFEDKLVDSGLIHYVALVSLKNFEFLYLEIQTT